MTFRAPTSAPLRTSLRAGLRAIAIVCVIASVAAVAVPGNAQDRQATVVYDDALGPGFQDWSWAAVDLASQAEVYDGVRSIAVDYGAWEGLYLGVEPLLAVAEGSSLRFSIMAPDPGRVIEVRMFDPAFDPGPAVSISLTAGEWRTVEIPVADLGGLTTTSGFWWQNATDAEARVYVDDISVVGGTPDPVPGPGPEPGPGPDPDPPVDGASLEVDLGARTIVRRITDPATDQGSDQVLAFPHEISEGVYGLNFAAPPLRDEFGIGINRWGGNGVERYNHLTGDSNKGHDYFFMTDPGDPGAVAAFEQANAAAGADTLLTVPLLGWVSDGPPACSYPVTDLFGPPNNASPMDQTATHWADGRVVCGNGYRGGQFVTGVDPALTSRSVDASFVGDWVGRLVAAHGSAAAGGIERYALGNEPGLWHATHGDLRTEPIGRRELIERNTTYAAAIKDADPTASVVGPVLWGGYSYFVTSQELAQGIRPGQVNTFVADYLDAMAAAERTAGRRLVDGLAIHFYDDRVYGGGTDALRLQSTRSLWDPSYAPADWWPIRDFLDGEGYAVVPRMQNLIDRHYPATELAITEYNFGGLDTLAGGLAQADALGIFGREGVDVATLWDPYNAELSPPLDDFTSTPAMFAYRLYRNYDGAGGRFGERSLFARADDPTELSIYAAHRGRDGATTIIVINKSTSARTERLAVTGDVGDRAEVFHYGAGDLTAIERQAPVAVDGGFSHTFPARSATLFVVEPGAGGPPPTPPPTVPPTSPPPTSPFDSVTIAPPSLPAPDAATRPRRRMYGVPGPSLPLAARKATLPAPQETPSAGG